MFLQSPFCETIGNLLNIILFDDQPSHLVRRNVGDNSSREAKASGLVKYSMIPFSLSWFGIEVDDAPGGGG